MWAYTEDKKNEYWDHMISFIEKNHYKYKSLTERRLRIAKQKLWDNDDFWWDVLIRHNGNEKKPDDCSDYNHMIGNMISMVTQCLHELGEKM